MVQFVEFLDALSGIGLVIIFGLAAIVVIIAIVLWLFDKLVRRLESEGEEDESSVYPHGRFDQGTPLPGFEQKVKGDDQI